MLRKRFVEFMLIGAVISTTIMINVNPIIPVKAMRDTRGVILNTYSREERVKQFEELTQKHIEEQEKLRLEEEQARLEIMRLREESKKQYYTFEVSFYCPCYNCTQNGNRQTASGTYAEEGRTIAMPSNIPFGTKVVIDGLGEFINEDRGGYIKNTYDENGNLIIRVDVFLEDHARCYENGRYLANGYIILE